MTQNIKISGNGVPARMFRKGLLPIVASLAAVLCFMTSCIYDSVTDGVDSETATMGINIRLMSTGVSSESENVDGSEYENYIDIVGADYRIYFFTNSVDSGNDTFIAQFYPTSFYENASGTYKTYSVTGQVPTSLGDREDFKVMVLANWGEDNYPTLTAASTIDDVCSSSNWGILKHKEDFELSAKNLIPMYGIHEYTGVTFEDGTITELPTAQPINLLRAMAKVEVVVDDSDMEFASVSIHNYNDRGYCAPSGIYVNDQYAESDGSGGWQYISTDVPLHLVGDENIPDSSKDTLKCAFTQNASNQNVWYAYVPEYRNTVTTEGVTTTADDYAYIQIDLVGNGTNSESYRLYFRDYVNGTAEAGADYDIGRNVLYRFTVSLKDYRLNVHVNKWEDSFRNDYSFNTDD